MPNVLVMPANFPAEYANFGRATGPFFAKATSDQDRNDILHRRTHFDWAWQAVRYRYRLCAECNDEFRVLQRNPSDRAQAGWFDQEYTYKLERCIYTFFMGGLSVFENLGFSLYYLGESVQPASFPFVSSPKKIMLTSTSQAYMAAFPQEPITDRLAELLQNPTFKTIDTFRNILAHRLSGRDSSYAVSATDRNGTHTYTEEKTWEVPGTTQSLPFDAEMLQRFLDEITTMLTTLTKAALEFAESHAPRIPRANP